MTAVGEGCKGCRGGGTTMSTLADGYCVVVWWCGGAVVWWRCAVFIYCRATAVCCATDSATLSTVPVPVPVPVLCGRGEWEWEV